MPNNMLAIVLLTTITQVLLSNSEVQGADLAKLIKSKYFVDKSDMVKLVFQSTRLLVLTAPRRFGKSTNLDIIKRFCEITVDKNGNRLLRRTTDNYKLFAENNLNVFKDRVFFNENFGRYPVVYVDFKQFDYSDYNAFIRSFRHFMFELFQSHYYLLNSAKVREIDVARKVIHRFYNRTHMDNVREESVKQCLFVLSGLLFAHYNRSKCVYLFDSYDQHLQDAVLTSSKDVKRIFEFIGELIDATVKYTEYHHKSIATSCLRIAPEKSPVNFVPFMKDYVYTKIHGFTEEEVKSLLEKHGVRDQFDKVEKWYGGYHYRDDDSVKVYSPYSIVNLLERKKYESYWVESVHAANVEKLMFNKNAHKTLNAMIKAKITELLNVKFGVEHIEKLKSFVNNPRSGDIDANLCLLFLTDLGYFNIVSETQTQTFIDFPNTDVEKYISISLLKKMKF